MIRATSSSHLPRRPGYHRWLPSALILLSSIALLVLPARSCGPDFPEAIFVLPESPGGNYAAFAAGRVGIPQSGYRTRHLVIAYDYLTQRPLTPAEQKQAIAANDNFLNPWYTDDQRKKSSTPSGFATWIDARKAFGPVDNYVPADDLATSRDVNYSDVPNCLDDAFVTAARTLNARTSAHGKQDPAVLEWVRGQDAVFTNCGDGKAPPYYGPGKPPPPPPAPHAPTAPAAGFPLWLQQDRDYQMAAAQFYAGKYDGAQAGFHAIGANLASPWSPIARYLIARTLIRKAEAATDRDFNAPQPTQSQLDAAHSQFVETLTLARKQLLSLQSDPALTPLHNAVDNLIDYLNLRIDPDAQAVILADRLHGTPGTHSFGQSLIDITWLRTNHDDPTAPPTSTPKPGSNDMLAWIDAVSTENEAASLQHWRSTPTSAWLFAAISFAKPSDAASPDLIRAAASVRSSDPAYVAITYHRLRLLPRTSATRADLLAVLPAIERNEAPSTVNLYTSLSANTAPTLEAWLATAGRKPAGETSWGDDDYIDTPPLPTDPASTQSSPQPSPEDVCGTRIALNSGKLFDLDAADVFNRQLPLRLLATAAESSTLPANLRFQVAQATWARAVLLDLQGNAANPELQSIARRMSPLLTQCRPAWKPVLAAYDASTSPTDRRANGLLALMRFASTEPSVRYGEERRSGFATYDEYRQNWWCTAIPKTGETVDFWAALNYQTNAAKLAVANPPPTPPFLTPADLAEAHTQIAALQTVPSASTYFAQQALTWAKLHPPASPKSDPRTPEILGQADRVVRNGCRNDPPYDSKKPLDPNDMTLTPNLAKAVFDVLHKDYPQSSWARRYKTWM